MKVALVLGTRPQIIKSAPLIYEALKYPEIELHIVHTGQHYDYKMSKIFFNELDLPEPVANLEVGSGTHAWQMGTMLIRLEKMIDSMKSNVVIVPGDTNSVLAGALVATKLHVPVGHLEAGARSYDMTMPEEVNRRLVDHCSNILFAVTENCLCNLYRENVPGKVYLTGDTMLDAFLSHFPEALKSDILDRLDLSPKTYMVLTLHRPANVDSPQVLKNVVEAMLELKETTVVFPVHPRTKNRLNSIEGYWRKLNEAMSVKFLAPVKYHDMLKLLAHAQLVLTDSGGLQKEAFWAGTPCLTLRQNTEWVETVQLGVNALVGSKKQDILREVNRCLENNRETPTLGAANPYGDGKASTKIIQAIIREH